MAEGTVYGNVIYPFNKAADRGYPAPTRFFTGQLV